MPATLAASASAAGRPASLAGPPPVARGWLALAGLGEEPGSVAALAEALTLARPEGYVRIFADEGTPTAPLLSRLIAAQRTGQGTAAAS